MVLARSELVSGLKHEVHIRGNRMSKIETHMRVYRPSPKPPQGGATTKALFPLDKPMPAALLKKIVKARIAPNEEKEAAKKRKK